MKKYVKYSVFAFIFCILITMIIDNTIFLILASINLVVFALIYIDDYINDFDEMYEIKEKIPTKLTYENYLENCRNYEIKPFDKKTFYKLHGISNPKDFVPTEFDDRLGKEDILGPEKIS